VEAEALAAAQRAVGARHGGASFWPAMCEAAADLVLAAEHGALKLDWKGFLRGMGAVARDPAAARLMDLRQPAAYPLISLLIDVKVSEAKQRELTAGWTFLETWGVSVLEGIRERERGQAAGLSEPARLRLQAAPPPPPLTPAPHPAPRSPAPHRPAAPPRSPPPPAPARRPQGGGAREDRAAAGAGARGAAARADAGEGPFSV
jgi:hypothetical protein